MHTFPRIGGASTVFDAVTVSYSGASGAYVATARRDGIKATRYVGSSNGQSTTSEDATAAAWSARCAMAGKWRDEGYRLAEEDASFADMLRKNSDRTFAEWTDPDRYAVVVSVEVPGHGYVVTFIPREQVQS